MVSGGCGSCALGLNPTHLLALFSRLSFSPIKEIDWHCLLLTCRTRGTNLNAGSWQPHCLQNPVAHALLGSNIRRLRYLCPVGMRDPSCSPALEGTPHSPLATEPPQRFYLQETAGRILRASSRTAGHNWSSSGWH